MKKEGRERKKRWPVLQDNVKTASWREGNGPEGPVRKPNNQSTADPSVCLPTCPWFAMPTITLSAGSRCLPCALPRDMLVRQWQWKKEPEKFCAFGIPKTRAGKQPTPVWRGADGTWWSPPHEGHLTVMGEGVNFAVTHAAAHALCIANMDPRALEARG